MKDKDLTITMSFDVSPKQVFDAVNDVRAWWSPDLKGKSDKLGAKFIYQYKDWHISTQKITEFVPNRRVVWYVVDASLSFVKHKKAWTGTDIVFEISKKGEKTQLRFTHRGLVPAFECYGACSDGWGYYIKKSLRSLIRTGEGRPNPEG